ncbi:MAG: tetratricopeptide repeat protein [Candidatus Omnitrophica bacterium]|nr:tetratricopeptide repeat protein [Candidatus Omnitrophota bacterium]
MNDEKKTTEAIEAVLRWHLPETLKLAHSDTPAPTTDELLDLIEGRLDATEREDLLDKLAMHRDSMDQLSDMLHGMAIEESMAPKIESKATVFSSAVEALRDWVQGLTFMMEPAEVAAYEANQHNCPSLDEMEQAFGDRIGEILDLIERGDEMSRVLTLQGTAMEIYLAFLKEDDSPISRFSETWKIVCEETLPGPLEDYFTPEGQMAFEKAYELVGKVYQKAIELDPADADPYVGLARINLKLGSQGLARQNLDRATALSPSHVDALRLRARMLN